MLFTYKIAFVFLILQTYSILPDEIRKELLEKLTREIYPDDDLSKETSFEDLNNKNLKNNFDYNITKINEILTRYDFPQNYNFFEDNEKITKKVKDQKKCGGCWAFASTSALAYRFEKKYGIKLDLSPQDGISCYIKDCEFGNYGVDAQLNLLINGTLTEDCFPFTSGEQPSILPECPNSCEDHSQFKKYYSKNAYTTEDVLYDNEEKDLYDFITIIIDQLITKGPLVTNIDIYDDFQSWFFDTLRCKTDAYAPGKNAEKENRGHAMVIVGYGFLETKNKYYWLIQNSWGTDSCDNGFFKLEFGKAGVEQVAFSEAYFPEEEEKEGDKTMVDVYYLDFDERCDLLINTTNTFEWNSTLEIKFKNENNDYEFFYYCTNYDFPQGNSAKCFYEILNHYKSKGNYIYDSYKSLDDKTIFNLDTSFIDKKFFFWGWADISPYLDDSFQDYYVSSEGTKIIFWYQPEGVDSHMPAIYPSYETNIPLKKCERKILNDYRDGEELIIICEIQKEEMDRIHEYDPEEYDYKYLWTYDILCGARENTITYVYKLDNKKYSIFNIKDFYYPNEGVITGEDKLTIYADISGDISYFNKNQNFIIFINITGNFENDVKSYTSILECAIGIPKQIQSNFKIECKNDLSKKEKLYFKDIYLFPYIILYKNAFPFEVKLNEILKGKVDNSGNKGDEGNKGTYMKSYLSYMFSILLLVVCVS